jgi:O-antigen biosynthesis protein
MPSDNSLRALYEEHEGKLADKWSLYLDVYERVLVPYRERPIAFVEVGVQNGGSLELWAKYFADARVVIGCDANPACGALRFDDPRIALLIGPINSPPVYREITARAPQIDVFIDDGSHHSRDIVNSFCNYFQHVAPGGLYIVEDLHCAYFRDWGGGYSEPAGAMGFLKLLADGLHHAYWKDQASFEAQVAPFLPPGAGMDASLAADIFAIAFFDSMCVIEKRAGGAEAGLGERVLVGREAPVDARPLKMRGNIVKGPVRNGRRARPLS